MGCQNAKPDIDINKNNTFEDPNVENPSAVAAAQIMSKPHLSSESLSAKCIFPSINIQPTNRLSQIEKELLSMSLLMEINKVRLSPSSYRLVVQKYMNKIHPASVTKNAYISVGPSSAIALKKGKAAFEDCLNFLSKQKAVNAIQLESELCIDFPANINDCVNMGYIERVIKEKYDKMNDRYKGNLQLKKFHFDVNAPSAEASCVMQIVDDTDSNLIRRTNLFNENINVVNINCELISKGIVCFYLAFGIKK